ncbi:hypothetical protein PC129_g23925 [Phytophthora cactorum]|uniref:Uncharacterized protein n=1 Tax=Phytophthora cactorum TaxID=29920 RepID=A0A8T1GTX3_9STRA|nr:hypothetical protein PC129_g23925 [Phytophthora cactorum]
MWNLRSTIGLVDDGRFADERTIGWTPWTGTGMSDDGMVLRGSNPGVNVDTMTTPDRECVKGAAEVSLGV